jgi:iron complex transport system substrate-binding protein
MATMRSLSVCLAVVCVVVVMAGAGAATATQDPEHRRAHFHDGVPLPAGTLPQRVVSLSPAVTETLFALGVSDRVVGVTRYCDRPIEATTRPSVGGYVDASLEAIVALRPDLVVAQPSFGQRALLDRLRGLGIAVYVVFADTLEEADGLILGLGALFGKDVAARALVERQRAIVSMPIASRPLRVVVVVGTDPLVVAGAGSFANEGVVHSGVVSAIQAGDPAWPLWSLETIASRRIDIVVAAEGPHQVKRLEALLAPLGARRPRVLAAPTAILMRPGPSFASDVVTLRELLTKAAP